MIKLSTLNLRRGNGQIKIPVVIDKREPYEDAMGKPTTKQFVLDRLAILGHVDHK